MKKRYCLFFAFLAVLAVSGVLLLRFATFGVPAGMRFDMNTEAESVSAADKLALKTQIDKRMAGQASSNESNRLTKVENLLLEYGCTGNMHLLPSLMEEGIFLLKQPGQHHVDTKYAARKGVDITVLSPMVFYDGYTQEWIILCGGWWNSDRWKSLFAGNVGSRNRFGITCVADPETYKSHVPYAAAGLWAADDTDYDFCSYTNYRAGGDGKGSFDFELQDHVVITGIYERHYVGEKWAGFCRFAPGYENYETVMSSYYICD